MGVQSASTVTTQMTYLSRASIQREAMPLTPLREP